MSIWAVRLVLALALVDPVAAQLGLVVAIFIMGHRHERTCLVGNNLLINGERCRCVAHIALISVLFK